jgi:lichenan operon transcriptional antiterminator
LNTILNREESITGSELAQLFHVSVRTIREDMKAINNLLSAYDIEISSTIKKGYFLSPENKDRLKESNVIRKVLDYEYIRELPDLPEDRQVYILCKLMGKDYVDIEAFTEQLYVSEGTINNDVIYINKWLKPCLQAKVGYSLNQGFTLKAEEAEKRNIISWVLSMRTNVSTISKYWNYLFGETDIIERARAVYRIVRKETMVHRYYLSGHSAQLFSYEILLAVGRFQRGFFLAEEEDSSKRLLPVMRAVCQQLEQSGILQMPEVEWLALQNYFKAKQFLAGTDLAEMNTREATRLLDCFLQLLEKRLPSAFLQIPDFRYKLFLYIVPMIERLRLRHCVANPIRESVLQRYPEAALLAKELAGLVLEQMGLFMGNKEMAYVVLQLAMIYEHSNHKLHIAIVCDYDESVVSFIRHRLQNNFGEKIEIDRSYDYQEFMFEEPENLAQVELIISTSTIADITDIPFVRVNPEVEQGDLNRIAEHIANPQKKI